MPAFRYSAPLIIPDASETKDKDTNLEITYTLNALRTLAAHIDAVTGALSPLEVDWPTTSAEFSILGNLTNKFHCRVGVNIPYGAMVNFYAFSPTEVQARPAQANVYTNAASGFCVIPGGFLAGEWGEFVVGPGINYGIAGMVPGNYYFLDPASALGQVTAVQPVVPGQIIQLFGVALRPDALLVGSLNSWRVI